MYLLIGNPKADPVDEARYNFGLQPAPAGAALEELIGYAASGRLHIPVAHVLPLARAAEAHRLIEARATTGKVVLKPWAA